MEPAINHGKCARGHFIFVHFSFFAVKTADEPQLLQLFNFRLNHCLISFAFYQKTFWTKTRETKNLNNEFKKTFLKHLHFHSLFSDVKTFGKKIRIIVFFLFWHIKTEEIRQVNGCQQLNTD